VAIATFLQLLRPQSIQEQRAQRLYRDQVQQMADRLRAIFDDWGAFREVEPDNTRLANAAAVNRWGLMRMAREAQRLRPPRALSNVHREVQNAVIDSARACQLLANGYRFHKSEAVCDGQALLVETVYDLADLLTQIQTR
jgi:signal transduction histidine kinase